MKQKIQKFLFMRKGGLTIQKLVLVVLGVSTMAVVMMTIKGAIDSAYAQGLQNALNN